MYLAINFLEWGVFGHIQLHMAGLKNCFILKTLEIKKCGSREYLRLVWPATTLESPIHGNQRVFLPTLLEV